MEDNKYTLKQMAQELDKSYSTTLNLVRTGKIKGNRYGGVWLVDKEEFERFKREGNHPDSIREGEYEADSN